jgi:hypothetical protein
MSGIKLITGGFGILIAEGRAAMPKKFHRGSTGIGFATAWPRSKES